MFYPGRRSKYSLKTYPINWKQALRNDRGTSVSLFLCIKLVDWKAVSPMTEKQKIFADEYLIDLNATRAYRAAYPSVKKEESAASAAARMLRNVKVAEYIAERMEERQKRTEITQDMVLQELAAIAFARATDYVSVRDGMVQVKDTDQLSDLQIAAITGIKETQNGIEVKLGSKEKTLELLGRHLGMWNDKINVEGQVETKNPFADLTTEELKKLVGDG